MHAAPLPPNPDPTLNQRVTAQLLEQHGVLLEEYEVIRRQLHRDPTVTELGVYGVMWSETCSYKNTRVLLKQLPLTKEGDCSKYGRVLVKAGEETAGIVDIGGAWAVVFKIATHNRPGETDPFESGSAGVGGIIRDVFTMGARPVLLTNSLRFGELSSPAAREQFRSAVSGVAHYGNASGIPVVAGDVYFDSAYEGAPLVNALCLGVLPHSQIRRGRASGLGNPVYCLGAPTGREGQGGTPHRPVGGDPSLGRLLIEACLELTAMPGLAVCIQDAGTAGLACAAARASQHGGAGVDLDLDRLPLAAEGMNSLEILLSQTQERVLVVAQRGREVEVESLCSKWGVKASLIGRITDTGRMLVRFKGVVVADLPSDALISKAPVYSREAVLPSYFGKTSSWTPEGAGLADLDEAGVLSSLPALLAHPTIASKHWVYDQYGHKALHGTLVEPGSDAAVVRVQLGVGQRLLAITNDCNGRFCYLNPRRGALIAIAEALRNLACSGAVPLAMTNNLNFGDPYNPEVFYQLKEAVRGMAEACRFFDLPVLGGNVSLGNGFEGRAIDPTPLVSVVGLIEEEAHITRQWVRAAGQKFVLLGGASSELGGSQYLEVIHGLKTGDAPVVDLGAEERLNQTVHTLIKAGLVVAAHDLSEGGLLVGACEMLFPPDKCFGARLDFSSVNCSRLDALLFGESQGRVILAMDQENLGRVISEAHMQGVSAAIIGEVLDEPALHLKCKVLSVSWDVTALRKGWETAIEEAMKVSGQGGG